MTTIDIERARAAKEALKERISGHKHVLGIGIHNDPDDYAVTVLVDSGLSPDVLPTEVDGVPVLVKHTGRPSTDW